MSSYSLGESNPLPRIAHAGGGIDEHRYTNSKQAILHSLSRGYQLIEIDFVWTSDRHLVCLHDWFYSADIFFTEQLVEPPLREEFLSWESSGGYTQMDVGILADIMHDHPQMKLVTDIKDDNIEGLKYLAAHIADYKVRVIPQFYQPETYEEIRKLGYQNLIWTLYQYKGGTQQVLAEARNMNLLAITMNRQRVISGLPKRLSELDIPVYAHTINDPIELAELQEDYSVSEVYTDFLPPN